jgi:type III secretory pathway component EscR
MNKWLLPLLLVSAGVALYEQSLPNPNYYLMGVAVVLFVFCMAKLNAKIPSKKENHEDE